MTSNLSSFSICKFCSAVVLNWQPIHFALSGISFLWLRIISGQKIHLYWHNVKSVRIRSYSGPHFSCVFTHSDWIRVSLRIQSKCGKMQKKCGPAKLRIRTHFMQCASGWYYGFNWRIKGRPIFLFNELLDKEQVCLCL